ncbi:TolC family protein [Paludibacter sp. 221]|uniref:TolC family protein n=1 Tax=Paludibacter sp. 221 TaxID=2302939 RepID=UPI0013D8618F|nr:TolC family protein [Paludibacter sp. 221]NDV47881.1 TolC family protein [Paludibacter sp. 221]
MRQNFIILLTLLCIPFAYPQEVYDLKRCIETGLEQNYQIAIIRNNQQISDNNATIGNAGFLPTLDLNSSFSGTLYNNEQYPHNTEEDVVSNKNVNNQSFNVGVNLNWMLFNGFSVLTNYDRLKELQQVGELNTRMTIENFIANISTEYYNYIQQTIRIKNLQSAVKLSKERLRTVEARYNIGNLSRLDLQQAKVDFNSDSSKLIRQQEVLFASRVRLNQLMSLNDIDAFSIPADSIITMDFLMNKEDIWQQTMESNTYLLLAEKNRRLSSLDLRSLQSQNLPYLRLNAGYGYSHNTYELGNYRRQDQLGPNYGLTLGFNLFNGFNRVREQRNAKLQIDNKELEYKELQLAVKSEFANLWMAYVNNMELTELEKENLLAARENHEIAVERYKLGDLSGIELREAQNSLLEAEERLVQAQYNTKLCEISLMQISGQITEYIK